MKSRQGTAVVGARGYAGQELARLLLAHPRLAGLPPVFCGREQDSLARVHPALRSLADEPSLAIHPMDWSMLEDRGVDTVFLATPHEQSRAWVPEALARGFRVVDPGGSRATLIVPCTASATTKGKRQPPSRRKLSTGSRS